MIPFKTLLQAGFDGTGIDLTTGTYEMLFTDGAEGVPADGDGGWDFEDDITTAGGTITHRETIPNVTFVNRVFDFDNFTITDPGGGAAAAHAYIIRQGTPSAATNRLVCHQDITDITWDAVNDEWQQDANGAFRVGGA